MTAMLDNIEPAIYVLAAICAITWVIYKNYRRKNHAVKLANTPVLLSYYTRGATLVPVKHGQFGDMNFSAFVTVNPEDLVSGGKAGLVFRVELPFQTSVHLLGIPKKGDEAQLNPAQMGSLMEPVVLEGNYSEYFDLFCEKGMQADARYVLDPKAMVFTLDFCQSQSWEIVAHELYFVQTGKNQADDPTLLSDDIVQFVREIEPAVAIPLTETQKIQATPYGKDRRSDLLCPLCLKTLTNTGQYFVCPNEDGVLLTGKQLAAVKKGSLKIPPMKSSAANRRHALRCPSCNNQMSHVAYNGGKTMIDSCSHCTYRWLDNGELAALPKLD